MIWHPARCALLKPRMERFGQQKIVFQITSMEHILTQIVVLNAKSGMIGQLRTNVNLATLMFVIIVLQSPAIPVIIYGTKIVHPISVQ
tara:strand:+ start:66 stop:329 length:264 start_codon:yes stop_codon:yes gene_type:complete